MKILTVTDFTQLPKERQDRLKVLLAERGVDFHRVVSIEKHPHTWTVTLVDRPPQAIDGQIITTQQTVKGGRW